MILSIITCSLNDCKQLEKTYNSLIHQVEQDFEWIIVDCGSIDGSIECIERFDKRFTRIVTAPDKGVFHALNKGAEVAAGEYLLFLHPGDFFLDGGIISAFFGQNPKEDIVSGDLIVKGSIYDVRFSPEETEITYQFMLEKPLFLSSSFIRRNLFVKYGGFDESFKIVADWKFFFICLIQHTCSFRKWGRCIISIDSDGISRNPEWVSLLESERERVKTEVLPYVRRTFISQNEQITSLQKALNTSFLERMGQFLKRVLRRLSSITCVHLLELRRICTTKKAKCKTKERVIISMTSWAKRIENVPLVVESILQNTTKPDTIVLNLSEEEFPEKELSLPKSVMNLVDKGVIELIWTPGNLKAFKKIIPTMKKYPDDMILAVDDDFYYPEDFIETFVDKHRQYPDSPISGNPFLVNGVIGHGGCASLVKARFYGRYIDELMDEKVLELKMDDIFYVFCAALNGYYYKYVGKMYYTNLRPIQGSDGLSDIGRDEANEAMKQYMVQKIKDRYHIDMRKIHKPFFTL